jgi:hypothetical protein
VNEQLREQFFAHWHAHYSETPPVGYLFKQRLAKRWVRFHSLPNSKQYADTEAERDEILRRQNTIINDLIGTHIDIRVVIVWINDDNPLFKMRSPDCIGKVSLGEGEPEFELFTYVTTWDPPDNVLLTMIADEQVEAFLIGPDCLIAPYDGGIDLILKDPHTSFAVKRKYDAWLPKRVDGL